MSGSRDTPAGNHFTLKTHATNHRVLSKRDVRSPTPEGGPRPASAGAENLLCAKSALPGNGSFWRLYNLEGTFSSIMPTGPVGFGGFSSCVDSPMARRAAPTIHPHQSAASSRYGGLSPMGWAWPFPQPSPSDEGRAPRNSTRRSPQSVDLLLNAE